MARSIMWVSVSILYSKPWARVMVLGPLKPPPVLFRCRSVLSPLSGCSEGPWCGVSSTSLTSQIIKHLEYKTLTCFIPSPCRQGSEHHSRNFQYRIVVLLQLLAPNDTRLIPRWLSLTLPQSLPAKRTSPPSLVVCADVHTYI